jgi:dTDP-4-amino-4,6-dideoxygalactose transaminase
MDMIEQRTADKQLAVLGGPPAFAEPLHVGRPNIGSRERFFDRMVGVLERNWLTNDGPLVREFEAAIAARLGVRHCVAMCNGTVALEIAIRALGLTGEVIVPGFTFVATAHALQWQEITPVFCDVSPTTHSLDPGVVEASITPRTTGLLGVHLWGMPCDVEALQRIADRHGLSLLFDAAHAFDCARGERRVGTFGRAEVLSFHATKFVNSFEGGAVVTNDDALAERMVLMRNFGFAGYDRVIYVGTNGKMTEPSAAMGLTNLEAIDDFINANVRNFETYRRRLDGLPGLRLVEPRPGDRWNHQYVVIEVSANAAGLTRDELVAVLHAEGVLARRYFTPGVHRMEPYRSYFPHAGLLLKETERLSEQVLVLPTGVSVGPGEVTTICEIIGRALTAAGPVRAALAAGTG